MNSRSEQETLINFNEAEPKAIIYTQNGALKRKLAKLADERPGDVHLNRRFPDGAEEYTIPKKWVKVNASRILTEEQRVRMTERGKELRKAQLGQIVG